MERQMQLERFGDEAISLVRRTEQSLLEAGRSWAKAMGEFMPADMPVVRSVVKDAFEFTEGVLKLQHHFVDEVLKATRPAAKAAGPGAHRAPRASGTEHAPRPAPRARAAS